MPKDYTQRRNERWETMFPGIGLESILGRILRIARYHNHKSTETMKPFGIKNGEADVLSALLHAGPPYTLNPKDITKHAYRTPGAITNVMDHLEEKGLIRRNADRENRRNVLVELTPEGLEMARESFLAQTDMEKRLLTMLSPEEKEQLRRSEAHPADLKSAGKSSRVPARPSEGIH
ncbi:MAG: MarR family winged helix-turn-helix transcriptional regulator [Bilophila wadsworthia]